MVRGAAPALWSAMVGATAAALAVYGLIQILQSSEGSVYQTISQYPVLYDYKESARTKSAEKIFYLLFYTLGVLCAATVLRYRRPLAHASTLTFVIAAAASLPALHVLIAGITQQGSLSLSALSFTLVALFVPAIARRRRVAVAEGLRQSSMPAFDSAFRRNDALVIAALALLIIPARFQHIAAESAAGNHPVSFLVGPALYALTDGLQPGRDFIAFYGHGPSYLFRALLNTDVEAVYFRYVAFLSAIIFAIHVSCYFVLRDFYRDRALACVVTIALIFTYHFGAGSTFAGPSAFPVRFALIFVLAIATVHAMTNPRSILSLAVCGVIVGASVFWNNETGVLMFVAVLASYTATELFHGKLPWRLFSFIASSLATFLAISAIAFGFVALDGSFFSALVEPLRLHATENWVGIVMMWAPGSGYIYQLGAPAVAIAAGTAALFSGRSAGSPLDRERAYLIFFCIVALIFTAKWINRSLDAVWQQNAFAFLIIGAWWLRIGLRRAYLFSPSPRSAATVVVSAGLFTLLMLWSITDRLQPNIKVGLRAYLEFPTAVNVARLFRRDTLQISVPLDDSDLKLVNSLLKPNEPMLLLSDFDWLLLIRLGRAPKSYFLPLRDTFSPEQLTRSFEGAKYLFIDRGADFSYYWLKVEFEKHLNRDFQLVAESTRLLAYERRP